MGQSFHEVQFPPSISLGATGGPGFSTTILTLASGAEKRNIDWSRARASYDVAHGLKTQAQLDVLIAFFRARYGRAYGFRFRDWTDFNLAAEGSAAPLLFTTDGATASFQIAKIYGDTGGQYRREIYKPVYGTLDLLHNGAPMTPVSVDWSKGIVLLPPEIIATTGDTITGGCEFDVPVRFDTDDMKVSITDYDNFAWGQIPLIETRDI